jgi:3-phenylpropionate/trans-cinnamate dioxygenase ferredoxin reductase subunit
MSAADDRIVIVGAGQCAASAASTLRSRGFDGEVVLVGAETELPYERPPLSKGYLLGECSADELSVRPAGWYAENAVELRLGMAVTAVDPEQRAVTLSTGESLSYHRLLIATGGSPRRLPGADGERILTLRERADADRLAACLGPGERLVILGGGFIGCEVAACARAAGAEVTILEMQDHPLQAAVGRQIGEVVSGIHRDAGVTLRTGERVTSVTEFADGLVVETDRGSLHCSRLLVAIGLAPNVGFLAGTPVACRDGVLVDELCETNVEGIYAAGDVAAHLHPTFGRHIRVEHYDNAIKQGAAAAASMLGETTPFIDPHWFWSDQHGHNLQSVGFPAGCDEVIVRGDLATRSFSVFYLQDGVVRSVFAIDRGKDVSVGRRMVLGEFRPDPALLRDPDVDLRRMLSGRQRRAQAA